MTWTPSRRRRPDPDGAGRPQIRRRPSAAWQPSGRRRPDGRRRAAAVRTRGAAPSNTATAAHGRLAAWIGAGGRRQHGRLGAPSADIGGRPQARRPDGGRTAAAARGRVAVGRQKLAPPPAAGRPTAWIGADGRRARVQRRHGRRRAAPVYYGRITARTADGRRPCGP